MDADQLRLLAVRLECLLVGDVGGVHREDLLHQLLVFLDDVPKPSQVRFVLQLFVVVQVCERLAAVSSSRSFFALARG